MSRFSMCILFSLLLFAIGCSEAGTSSISGDAGSDSGSDTGSDTDTDTKAATPTDTDTDTDTDTKADTATDSDTDADTNTNTDTSTGTDARTDTYTSTGTDSEPIACSFLQEGFSTLKGGTTGGEGGSTVTVTTQDDLKKYAGASEPYVIRVAGKIVMSEKGYEIPVKSNKTIIGVGTSGEISRGGFVMSSGTNNVIIRNLTIGDTYKEDDPNGKNNDWDGIQMDTAHHIWIDHCDLHHGGDGLIDSRKNTTNLTVSWTIIRNHNKAFGIGWVAKGDVKTEMTIHHNWVHDTIQRNPSTDEVLRAHLYNNYLQDIKLYGTWARGGTNMVLEHCVFDNVSNPYFVNSTGVDITSYGFDSEDDHSGELIAIGNIVHDNCTGKTESTGTTYKFFDPHDSYPYKLDPAEGLETLLAKCAGPRPELGLK